MKSIIKTALVAIAAAAISTASTAAEFTKGEVKKIDLKQKKITIKHEELKGLDMPAMTMVFVAERRSSACQGKTGPIDRIRCREDQWQAYGH